MTHTAPKLLVASLFLSLSMSACFHTEEETDAHDEAATISIDAGNVLSESSSTVTATAEIDLNNSMELSGTVTVANDTGNSVSKVEIRNGDFGEDGDLVVALEDNENGTWSVPAGHTVMHTMHMRHMIGGLYVSVSDADGEILRGQIAPHGVYAERIHLMAIAGVTTDGHGNAFITVDSENNTVLAYVHTHDIADTITAVEIIDSKDDSVILSLTEETDSDAWSLEDGAATLTAEQREALEADEYYVIVKTDANTDGELKGTIAIEMTHHEDEMPMDDGHNHMH